ncbi:hypothetical protein C5167_047434 [Papaver somniferum]|uniref:Uncharacterized protein n=1 Tax=Papaver somniferum TaxID=3469 RepID=A0A4Y7LI38_PAPSO|nr:hypothetical protein C5167_047434 [Papaver somniferum]
MIAVTWSCSEYGSRLNADELRRRATYSEARVTDVGAIAGDGCIGMVVCQLEVVAAEGYKQNVKDIVQGVLFPGSGLDKAVGLGGGPRELFIVRDLKPILDM